MKRLEKKHPRVIRWCHWINFPLLAIMIWSGILIYWANPVYRIGLGDSTLVAMKFSPETFKTLSLNNRLAQGMAFHFLFMWFFLVNGILYVIYTLVSGEWRYLVPNRQSFLEAIQVTLHDLHLTKKAPPPRKFNGAQQIAYTGIILMGFGSIVTGLAIYKPVQFQWLTLVFGGYQGARFVHFWLTMGYLGFFVIHVAQVIRAGWNNFRAMLNGYEIVDEVE